MKIPVLKLGDVIMTSVQEDLDDHSVLAFQADLLDRVAKDETMGVVIDISAVEIVDTFLARVLNETANMVQLLGANVVLCGMQPAVSLTLVEMGRELIGVHTALDLQQGMNYISEKIAARKIGVVNGRD